METGVRLTADVVLIAPGHILLIRRCHDPFAGRWALPGGRVESGEETATAARRELREEAGLDVAVLIPVGVYAKPERDPRGRYVTFAYTAYLTGGPPVPTAGDDAADARWWPITELLAVPLAFDHRRIIEDALEYWRSRLTIATSGEALPLGGSR